MLRTTLPCLLLLAGLILTDISLDGADKKGAQSLLAQFKRLYTPAEGGTTQKIYYIGRMRKYIKKDGTAKTARETHRFGVVTLFPQCGLKIDAHWVMDCTAGEPSCDSLTQGRVKILQKPSLKIPEPDDRNLAEIIMQTVRGSDARITVANIRLIKKTLAWSGCDPLYQVTSRAQVSVEDSRFETKDIYDCSLSTTLRYADKNWLVDSTSCLDGNSQYPCTFETVCKKTSSASTIAGPSDEEALTLIRGSYENQYGLMRDNAEIERFRIIKKLPPEDFGTTIPYLIEVTVVIDEAVIEEKNSAGRKKSLARVRALYNCIVRGHISYFRQERTWKGFTDSCCSSIEGDCNKPCSYPAKGCKRTGEK